MEQEAVNAAIDQLIEKYNEKLGGETKRMSAIRVAKVMVLCELKQNLGIA